METLRHSRSRAVLMANHGPFTIGVNARDAVKAAVMVEDVARTVHLARVHGAPVPLDPTDIDSLQPACRLKAKRCSQHAARHSPTTWSPITLIG